MEPHTTYIEMQFIDGLGQWSEHKYDRMMLIKKYINAASRRKNWGGVDKSQVMAYAWSSLKNG